MELFDAIKNRRSIRSYTEQPVQSSDLTQILLAGSYAPSGSNSRTTHRLVIQDRTVLTELESLVIQEMAKLEITDGMYGSLKSSILLSRKGTYQYDFGAPVLIVVSNRLGYGNALVDSACMIGNMWLQATALGLGACWVNQLHWLDENPVIREKLYTLGLHENETITGGLTIGYPKTTPTKALPQTGNEITFV